jgi:excinuclease ABC subunit C
MLTKAKNFLKQVPIQPGIYQMLDSSSDVIYVGKAKNLHKRLSSYFQKTIINNKTRLMMEKTVDIQYTVTHTSNEALILENNLIKKLKPRYNILMRDDKTYPFIVLTEHKFPRLSSYKGNKKKGNHYFGPYTNSSAVKTSLDILQKLFKLRTCTNSYFNNRSRPCLQYQIERCTAPCVNYINENDYTENVNKSILFLKGKSDQLIKDITQQMDGASKSLDYELATQKRDQIKQLQLIQEQQFVMQGNDTFDVVTVMEKQQYVAIGLLTIHEGKLLSQQTFYPKTHGENLTLIVSSFINQYYLEREHIPSTILVDRKLEDTHWAESVLEEKHNKSLKIIVPQRGNKMQWLKLSNNNLDLALNNYIDNKLSQEKRFKLVADVLKIKGPLSIVECFDISHTQGEATTASCVVFDKAGGIKKSYRRYNINDVQPGDDCAALKQAVKRRYSRFKSTDKPLPDLIIIDGGKTQLKQVHDVFTELELSTALISISKGPGRQAKYDVIWQIGKNNALALEPHSIVLHSIQKIRDEAHRFALAGHIMKRDRKRQTSVLEEIEGVGPRRRRNLLKKFLGIQGLQKASVNEIEQVDGISHKLAQNIYDHLHE